MRQILITTRSSEVHHEQRHRPIHLFQFPTHDSAAFMLAIKTGIRVMNVSIGYYQIERLAIAMLVTHLMLHPAATAAFDKNLFNRRVQSQLSTKSLKELDQRFDQRPGATAGKEDAPLPFDPVDQRINRTGLHRIAADQQRVEAERLSQPIVFDET